MPVASNLLSETQYFPPIAFYAKARHFDQITIEAEENFQKGGYRNRCLIAGANGVQMLSIPLVQGKHQQANIKEVRISYTENWQSNHWRSIQSAYGKSPFFEYYELDLEKFYTKEYLYLFEWNMDLLKTIRDLMQFEFEIERSTAYHPTPTNDTYDFRNKLSPKTHKENGQALMRYPQVFEAKNGFIPNLSILDLLFCAGPEATKYLETKPNK